VLEVGLGKVSLQPALLFSQKGEISHTVYDLHSNNAYFFVYAEETSTNRYNWLELPLNIVYTQHGDHGFQLFGGPYVALAIGGHQTGTRYTNSSGIRGPLTEQVDKQITYGTETPNRRVDAGVNFGVGYRQGPLQVQLGYSLGMRNLHQADPTETPDSQRGPYPYHNFEADAAYNRGAQLTGTYFFAL
jgi:hypothetical protein